MKRILAVLILAAIMWTQLSLAEEGEEIVTSSTVMMKAKVDTDLRLWAMFEGPSYGTLLKGETVEITAFYPDSQNVWGEIRYDNPDFKFGYVDVNDLEFTSTNDRRFTFAEAMKVTGNTVNIREYGNIQAEQIGILHKNAIVYVEKCVPTSDGRIWARCRDEEEGYIGWVSMKYLAVAK